MNGWAARLCLSLLLLLAMASTAGAQLAPGIYPAMVTVNADGRVSWEVRTTVAVPVYTLEIVLSGSGCTPTPNVGSHVYQSGSLVAMNATCSGSFVSWTGDSGCEGGQSHSITMNGNKRCTITATP